MIYGLSCIEEGKLALGGGVKHLFFFLLKEVSSCGGMFYREKQKLMEFFPSSNELVLVFKEIVEQCNSILLQFDSDFTFFNVGYTIKIV